MFQTFWVLSFLSMPFDFPDTPQLLDIATDAQFGLRLSKSLFRFLPENRNGFVC